MLALVWAARLLQLTVFGAGVLTGLGIADHETGQIVVGILVGVVAYATLNFELALEDEE